MTKKDEAVKPKREYRSDLRSARAAATRQAILGAARAEFAENGYAGSSIDSIARRAGVAPPTVYAVFGGKPAVASALLDTVLVGDDAPVALMDRQWYQQMVDAETAAEQIRLLARMHRKILERSADVQSVILTAGTTDVAMAERWNLNEQQRLTVMRTIARSLAEKPGAHPELDPPAVADQLFVLLSLETWLLLVGRRGYTPRRFEQWLATTLAVSVLAQPRPSTPVRKGPEVRSR
jgi:AcrR family transcriptional regulator